MEDQGEEPMQGFSVQLNKSFILSELSFKIGSIAPGIRALCQDLYKINDRKIPLNFMKDLAR